MVETLRWMLRFAGRIALIVAVIFILQELDAAAYEQVTQTELALSNGSPEVPDLLGYQALKWLGY